MIANNSQPILLTGGAGFIGSHLAETLLRAGAQVAILDNLNDFYSPAWKKANLEQIRRAASFDFFEVDLTDTARLTEAFERVRPSMVVHLAAYAGVRPSIANPALYERVNVGGTVNLLELCRKFQVGKFIFGSSSSVYGASSRAPFRENEVEARPISPYAATKLAGELISYTYAHLFAIETVCLRFFTVYGPRQRPDLAIHKFTALVEAGKPIPIFGDGSMGRDYTHVDDIVAGVIAAMQYRPPQDHTGARYDIFNLGNSRPITLNELLAELETATGKPVMRDPKPLQPGDVPLTWADTRKSEKLLGFRATTPFQKGLRSFVEWYRGTDEALRC